MDYIVNTFAFWNWLIASAAVLLTASLLWRADIKSRKR